MSADVAPAIDFSIQSRTVRALSMVSAVVIVFETTTTRVDSASRPVHGKEGSLRILYTHADISRSDWIVY